MKYRAVYERDPDGRWIVEIPEVAGCHTYGRTIDQARSRIREALGLYVEDAADAEIVDDVRLPVRALNLVRGAKKLREKVARQETMMVEAQVKAVKTLREGLKLGHRDAGRILGLSHQRVQQLEKRRTAGTMQRRSAADRKRSRSSDSNQDQR